MSSEPSLRGVTGGGARRGRQWVLLALAVVLGLEALAMTAVTVLIVVETFTAPTASLASAAALAVSTGIAAATIIAATVAVWRRARWFRGPMVVWQLIQALVGAYAFQGAQSRPDLGLALIVPALLALVLLFSPAVSALVRRD